MAPRLPGAPAPPPRPPDRDPGPPHGVTRRAFRCTLQVRMRARSLATSVAMAVVHPPLLQGERLSTPASERDGPDAAVRHARRTPADGGDHDQPSYDRRADVPGAHAGALRSE